MAQAPHYGGEGVVWDCQGSQRQGDGAGVMCYTTRDCQPACQGSERQGDGEGVMWDCQGSEIQGDAMQGKGMPQEEVESEATTFEENPTENKREGGQKRANEDNQPDNVKHAKDELSKFNPVLVLNEKMKGLEYKWTQKDRKGHSDFHTMEITVGGRKFEATSSNKRQAKRLVAEAALKYLADNNISEGQVTYRRACKNPCPTEIVNQLQAAHKYEYLEELEENDIIYHRMRLIVGDEQFEAKGRNKLLAKNYAAMYALQKLFNLKFTVPDFEQMPTFDGEKQEWLKYKKVIHFEGQHPVRVMNRIYGHLPFQIVEVNEPTQENIKFECTLKIADVVFTGTGVSRNMSKMNTCREALNYHKENGLLKIEKAESEITSENQLAEITVEQENDSWWP